MRQGQQNRRGRGRSNNNNNNNHNNNHQHGRKGQNPLTRNFESNGPDVKIKGTPAHVAEKYMAYARDALTTGDPVLAENFLQHAEHYNRIILTYREQQLQQNADGPNGAPNGRPHNNNQPNSGGDTRASVDAEGADAQSGRPASQSAPQPDVNPDDQQPQRSRNPRQPRPSRNDGERPQRGRSGGPPRQPRSNASDSSAPRDRFGDADEQPQFLRRPVRRTRDDNAGESQAAEAPTATVAAEATHAPDDAQD